MWYVPLLLHVPSTTGRCHGVLLVGVASSSGALFLLPRSLRDDLEKWERLYGACFHRVGGGSELILFALRLFGGGIAGGL